MRRRPLIFAVILMTAVGAVMVFTYRVGIREAIVEARRPALPAPRPYVPPSDVVPTEKIVVSDAPVETPPVAKPAVPAPVVAPDTDTDVSASVAVNLAVPFTSQAPHANWDLPFQEACEEASLIMVNAWMVGTPPGTLNPDVIEPLIRELVAWQIERFGYYKDTTAEETAIIAREHYGYVHTEVLPVTSIESVKRQVAKGYAVILPASGTKLHNPYFHGVGPVYHMLVVKGYTEDGRIITNDPGTRRGADFLYNPDTLFNAIGDWNDGNPNDGAKLMIILKP